MFILFVNDVRYIDEKFLSNILVSKNNIQDILCGKLYFQIYPLMQQTKFTKRFQRE